MEFTTSSYLITHKQIHSGENPLQCDNCEKAFTTSSYLTIHKQSHFEEKLFQCVKEYLLNLAI